MDEIEMQLVKIQDEEPEPVNTNILLDDTSQPFQTFGTDMLNAAAIYHVSYSDYEPSGEDNTEAYLQTATIADNNLEPVNTTTMQNIDLADTSLPFPTFGTDQGVMYHLSDLDYEPLGEDNTEALLQAEAIAEKNLEEFIDFKSAPISEMSKKPNILKKKETNYPKKLQVANKTVKNESMARVVSRNGALYTCLLCEGETVCGEAKPIILHVRQAHDARLHICDVCGQDFRKRNELSTHLDEHVTTAKGDLQCEVCHKIFDNVRLFRVHKQMHFAPNKAWVCDICQKRYSSKNLLDEHINIHTGVRPYVCQTCGKDFASKYTFKAHEKTHEVRPRPFQCQHCSKSFLKQHNLTQHEQTHSGLKQFACQLCPKKFVSARNLEVHSIIHTGSKPFKCRFCEKAFARKSEVQDHERTHTGERPYKCEICSATFNQRSNLRSHKRTRHYDDKRHKCEKCEKRFKRRRLLDYHIKTIHTGERPYKCPDCNATFVYSEHLKKHTRIHTGDKPYLCEVCNKAFNSRDNRNAHRFVHFATKRYECLVCGSGFMRKSSLRQHMQDKGHNSADILVNQPRLITDGDQVITVNADDELEIVESNAAVAVKSIEVPKYDGMVNSQHIDHILVQGDEMFADTNSFVNLYEEQIGEIESVEYVIIDGQKIQFAEEAGGEEQEGEQVIASIEEFEDTIASENLIDGETQISQGPDGPI